VTAGRRRSRRKKKKRASTRKRQIKIIKKLSRRAPARPTRAHEGNRRRREKERTEDFLKELEE